jgi:hypothetical protein
MSRRFAAALIASVFASMLADSRMLGAMSDNARPLADQDETSLADLAAEAGATAALAAHCNTDPAPLRSAYARALSVAAVDIAVRQTLWRRYDTAQSAGTVALRGFGQAECVNISSMIKSTVRDLERSSVGGVNNTEEPDP